MGVQVTAPRYRSKAVSVGRCSRCKAPAEIGRFCPRHWFNNMAMNHTGERCHGALLKRLWEKQGGRCIYTGELLTPGKNASLDHRIPISRGGTHEEENLQWVSLRVNQMKTDMTHDEFLKMCHIVVVFNSPEA